MMEKGSELIAQVLPGLSPVMADPIEKLRMSIPRALAEMSASGMGGMEGGAAPAAPPMLRPAPVGGIPMAA